MERNRSTQESVPRTLDDPLPDSPLPLLVDWLAEARRAPSIRNADAMALATVDADGLPRVRFVLCRGFEAQRGWFTFYTNHESAKGRELASLAYASAAIYWDPLGRQVRISGPVEHASAAVSDAYFASRPAASQLAAWASAQSQPVASRAGLEALFARQEALLGDGSEKPIPRPPHWGGFVLQAERIELWTDRAGRLHDRAVWTRPSVHGAGWVVQRLQP